ncbi:MAG: hypothetical protein AAGH99_16210 [Planctomycetota bacterium]
MNKLFALTALAAALTFAGTAPAEARTQHQSANNARVAFTNFQSQESTYALTGQTSEVQKANRHYFRNSGIIRGGRNVSR